MKRNEICNIIELKEGAVFTLVTPSRERRRPWIVTEVIQSYGEPFKIKAKRRDQVHPKVKIFSGQTKIIYLHG